MKKEQKQGFSSLGVSQEITHLLTKKEITIPTPVQEKCIPLALEGKDVIGVAQTGTGKTFAFCLPALEHLLDQKGNILILLPTRELAIQVYDEIALFKPLIERQAALLIGGVPIFKQKKQLRHKPRIVIATPGRLIDHIKNKNYSLSRTNFLVLDEADRMLDIGFMPQLKEIFNLLPKERQTLLFSATMSKEILDISNTYMTNQVKIEVTPQGTSSEHITQTGLVVSPNKKHTALENFISENQEKTIVFIRTKMKAKRTTAKLRKAGIKAAEMHSNKSLAQRKRSLKDFKVGKCTVLVATDIAARGIHVDDIKHVINFDLPDCIEDYVHRIGRTGRAGEKGNALTFIEPDQQHKLHKIQKLVNKKLLIHDESEEFVKTQSKKPFRRRRNRRFRSR